jgi:RNA polymerase sigma-70 factor (ECF subfamily)
MNTPLRMVAAPPAPFAPFASLLHRAPESRAAAVVHRLPNAAGVEDADLARMAAAGDPRAASALWDRYSGLLRGILRRSLGPEGDVEDLLQEAFVGLFRTLPGLRDPELLRSFVAGTAFRIARSELRRRKVRRWVSLTATGSLEETPQPGASDPEARRAVKRLYELLDQLDNRGRMAFVLRHFEGYEMAELAQALRCSIATAKRSLTRVEGRLNAMVKRDPLLAVYLRRDRNEEQRGEQRHEWREELADAAE